MPHLCLALNQPRPYKFKYITVDEGLSHTDANDVAQDKLGYIWIATYFGLDRFDGYAVKKYYNTNVPINNAFKNRLNCIYPDSQGNIWIGSEDGLQSFDPKLEKYTDYTIKNSKANPSFQKIFKPDGDRLYVYTGNEIKLYTIKGNIIEEIKMNFPQHIHFSDMVADKDGRVYLSGNTGIWSLDQKGKLSQIVIAGLPIADFNHLYIDKQQNLLISSGNKLYLITSNHSGKNALQSNNWHLECQFKADNTNYIKNITGSRNSGYWLNTRTGLIRLDGSLNYIQTVNNKSSANSLNSNSLSKIFVDRSDCLWVCTFGGGLNYCDLNEKLFYTLQHDPETKNSLSGNHIRSILADGENLWIGTTANGLNLYNLKTKKYTLYTSKDPNKRLNSDAITSLTLDNEHNLWIGSTSGINIMRPDRKGLLRLPGSETFPTYAIDALVKDCFGNIWFGNHSDRSGVIWRDKAKTYHVKYYDYGEGYCILADNKLPQLFLSSTHGLKRIIIDEQGNIKKTYRYNAALYGNALSSDYTYPIKMQNDSTYWIGTMGGGINRLTLNTKTNVYNIKSYAGNYGVFNDVESIEIDNTGNIWIGGNGLEALNPNTGKLTRYDKNDGLQGNSFKVGSSYKDKNGMLYFGGINGLNYFQPEQIKSNSIPAQPVLTDILINNLKPHYGDADKTAIKEAVSYTENLKLNYLQNNFVVFFSAMHFANPLKCKYRYKLAGFDKDWRSTDGKNPSAAYSNLDYGTYKFIVEATNNDGVWSKHNASASIIITPPWWKSIMAKAIYVLLFLSILAAIYISQAKWHRLEREIEIRSVNEKKREEMHQQKEELYQQQLLFFTNVSHEFRTPLTLILGPLESLINDNKNTALDYSYQLMFRNAKRLMNLISELMNFKKVADSIVRLQVQPLEINSFCNDLTWEFQNMAISKGINFRVKDHTKDVKPWPIVGPFDVQILEKILFNLLNNSFKYTNAGGEIIFELALNLEQLKPSFDTGFELLHAEHQAKKYVYFRVADTGIGISNESINKIFERYYRISKNHLGSGVGLALVKSLTQLHKGNIYVYSERYQGTEIIIGIPLGEENYLESEKIKAGSEQHAELEMIEAINYAPVIQNGIQHHENAGKVQKRILLVEDNQELRSFLRQTLEKLYFIYEAEDGFSAIDIAVEKTPDLIISDVMMPGMNGIEFCSIIKQKFETSHIPFIILSAKDALESKIKGMESGADFYFAKPLSVELLQLTVNNIFEQAEKLKNRYTNDYLAEATELVHSEKDKEFVQRLLNLIEENIKDPEMDVDFLCKHLYISRTKLYQKIKGISDQSVGEFIRTIRLKKAVQIMTHEDIAMSEIVDRIGFQSSSNFSRAFKKEYGKSPLQFLQSLKNGAQVF